MHYSMLLLEIIVWVLFPACNFLTWYYIASSGSISFVHTPKCDAVSAANYDSAHSTFRPMFSGTPSEVFQSHREKRIVKLNMPYETTIMNPYSHTRCTTIANGMSHENGACFAVASTRRTNNSYLLQRYTDVPSLEGIFSPTGFFSRPGNRKGRKRFTEKLGPLLATLSPVEEEMQEILEGRGLMSGSDVVVMVVNDGEMDLFMNFACSCAHHNLSLSSVVVFAASSEIVPLITATGALGYYHSDFASASRESSKVYLDGIFVDMMWYKAFSVWLMLKLGYNVLFQDIDIVWFKDPFPYFHEFIASVEATDANSPLPDAFLSDDGQRSTVRYSPFYANSGFYYFLSNPRTLNVAWNIMLSFDVMQSGGSHQNVFTQRLLEAVDLGQIHTQGLHQRDFTNGASYHHSPGFMKMIANGEATPYMFHMCWTANKAQKLEFFRKVKMWYISEKYHLEDFIPGGSISNKAKAMSKLLPRDQWKSMSSTFCSAVPNAP
mmetsp:Transcript_7742/g.11496  ORF Transcript_7742/g.11496 Transcript_7742/m.11496 type:complete len:492 (+) Transcript_7742:29-1504(+)